MPDPPVVGQAGHDTLSIIVGFSLAWMIASQFDRKSVQNSPLKMFPSESSQARFGTTVVPPFAIAKPFNAALLAGVRSAQVLCLVEAEYLLARFTTAHGLKIANQSTFFNTSYRLEVADMELTFACLW